MVYRRLGTGSLSPLFPIGISLDLPKVNYRVVQALWLFFRALACAAAQSLLSISDLILTLGIGLTFDGGLLFIIPMRPIRTCFLSSLPYLSVSRLSPNTNRIVLQNCLKHLTQAL